MSNIPPPPAPAVPVASASINPVKRRRRRRRHNNQKKQNKTQHNNHDELAETIDSIRDLLEVVVRELISARQDRQDDALNNRHETCQCDSCQTQSIPDTTNEQTTINLDKVMKLSESFFLLEMGLNLTRERLHDLRAILAHTTDEYLQDILEITEGLETHIKRDLDRLCTITRQQYDAGLTDYVPPMGQHQLRRPWDTVISQDQLPAERDSVNASMTAYGTPGLEEDQSTDFWEWVHPSLYGLAHPPRRN
ncbi:hypothetical protein GGS21DRAFT_492070 [Xylaria nigripes]|nr:hypothetical protein GGS21DRAFT_492070 [Xylaria nigripes]